MNDINKNDKIYHAPLSVSYKGQTVLVLSFNSVTSLMYFKVMFLRQFSLSCTKICCHNFFKRNDRYDNTFSFGSISSGNSQKILYNSVGVKIVLPDIKYFHSSIYLKLSPISLETRVGELKINHAFMQIKTHALFLNIYYVYIFCLQG